MRYAWIIRPYPHGKYRLKEFLSKNIIAIGWPCVGDLSKAKTREEIKKAISRDYTYTSSQSLGQAAGNIYRFKVEIQNEDFVLVPDGQLIYIGRVVSDYQYDPTVDSGDDGYCHQRKVQWLFDKRAIRRNLLSGRVYDSLKGRQTVFTTYHEDIEEIVQHKRQLFTTQSNIDLKKDYLERLQKGLLRNVNSNTFEDAVCNLFSTYFPGLRRLSTTNSADGDTDLLAELPGIVNIRIQVKHFYPEQGGVQAWVVKQLAKSMEAGDHGIIVTSGTIENSAILEAETYKDRTITFIDGEQFVEYLFESLDNMSKDTLVAFGLTSNYVFL